MDRSNFLVKLNKKWPTANRLTLNEEEKMLMLFILIGIDVNLEDNLIPKCGGGEEKNILT